MGEIADSIWPQVFQMKYCETVRAGGSRILATFYGVDNVRFRKRSVRAVQRVVNFQIFINLSSVLIVFVFLNVSVILDKLVSDGGFLRDKFSIKRNWLIWRRSRSLPRQTLQKTPVTSWIRSCLPH